MLTVLDKAGLNKLNTAGQEVSLRHNADKYDLAVQILEQSCPILQSCKASWGARYLIKNRHRNRKELATIQGQSTNLEATADNTIATVAKHSKLRKMQDISFATPTHINSRKTTDTSISKRKSKGKRQSAPAIDTITSAFQTTSADRSAGSQIASNALSNTSVRPASLSNNNNHSHVLDKSTAANDRPIEDPSEAAVADDDSSALDDDGSDAYIEDDGSDAYVEEMIGSDRLISTRTQRLTTERDVAGQEAALVLEESLETGSEITPANISTSIAGDVQDNVADNIVQDNADVVIGSMPRDAQIEGARQDPSHTTGIINVVPSAAAAGGAPEQRNADTPSRQQQNRQNKYSRRCRTDSLTPPPTKDSEEYARALLRRAGPQKNNGKIRLTTASGKRLNVGSKNFLRRVDELCEQANWTDPDPDLDWVFELNRMLDDKRSKQQERRSAKKHAAAIVSIAERAARDREEAALDDVADGRPSMTNPPITVSTQASAGVFTPNFASGGRTVRDLIAVLDDPSVDKAEGILTKPAKCRWKICFRHPRCIAKRQRREQKQSIAAGMSLDSTAASKSHLSVSTRAGSLQASLNPFSKSSSRGRHRCQPLTTPTPAGCSGETQETGLFRGLSLRHAVQI